MLRITVIVLVIYTVAVCVLTKTEHPHNKGNLRRPVECYHV